MLLFVADSLEILKIADYVLTSKVKAPALEKVATVLLFTADSLETLQIVGCSRRL